MNKDLKQLIELSQIDIKINSFEPKIANANKKLIEIETQKSDISNKLESVNEQIKDAKLSKSKNENHLAELSKRLELIAKKSANVKTEREAKSLNVEEELAKEQIGHANEEIERLDKVVASKNLDRLELEKSLADLELTVSSIRDSIKGDIDIIEKERVVIFGQKEKLISEMEQKVVIFYEKIKRWAKESTVVPIKKQACYGCFMKISDKIYAEIVRGEEIVTCPHCGRIIYIEGQE